MSFSQLYPIPPESHSTIHMSVILRRLVDNVPSDTFTLNWVVENMPNRSYGVVILFLGLISFIPIISIFSRLLIMLFTLQIVLGFRHPTLPERIMMRALPSHHLRKLPSYTFSALTYIEKTIRPRWELYLGVRRLSGVIVFLLSLISLLAPIPFANVPAAAITVLMALAYLEHDGLLLVFTQILGFVMLTLISMAAFGATHI
jgi:hypothetical protein